MENIIDENKVIYFNKERRKLNNKITDKDINALFMGLLKIVKKSAREEVSEDLKEDCLSANENFREALIELQQVKIELKKERDKNSYLQNKVDNQQKQICSLLSAKCC